MNTVTRKFAAAVIAVAVIGSSLLGAQSASAAPHHKKHTSSTVHALSTVPGYGPVLNGEASCQADGTYTVAWHADAYPYDYSISAPYNLSPAGSVYVVGPFIRHIAVQSVTQYRIAGTSTSAGLTVNFNRTVSGTAYSWPLSGTITLDGACGA